MPVEPGRHHRQEHQRGHHEVAGAQQRGGREHGDDERRSVATAGGRGQDRDHQLEDEHPLADRVEGRRPPLDDVGEDVLAAAAARAGTRAPGPEGPDGAEQHPRHRPPEARAARRRVDRRRGAARAAATTSSTTPSGNDPWGSPTPTRWAPATAGRAAPPWPGRRSARQTRPDHERPLGPQPGPDREEQPATARRSEQPVRRAQQRPAAGRPGAPPRTPDEQPHAAEPADCLGDRRRASDASQLCTTQGSPAAVKV